MFGMTWCNMSKFASKTNDFVKGNYFCLQRKASGWKVGLPDNRSDGVNSSSRLSIFLQACSSKGLTADNLQDCTYFNEMRERRDAVQVKFF